MRYTTNNNIQMGTIINKKKEVSSSHVDKFGKSKSSNTNDSIDYSKKLINGFITLSVEQVESERSKAYDYVL